jgi:hypothetical protein
MPPSTNILDDLLPLLIPRRAQVLVNAAVLETANAAQLVELAANPKIRRFLLGRLSDTVALIDPHATGALAKALLAGGYTPKMAKGGKA